MSEQPLTYEGVLEMFRESRRDFDQMMQETALVIQEIGRKQEETARQMKEAGKKIASLGSCIGEIVENMVKGNIVAKFQALNYDITEYNPNKSFKNKDLGISGEIDLFLENGDIAILIEVKTTLETVDVREHIERIKKFRRYVEAKGNGDKRRFIGAVAGAVVKAEAAIFAHESGLYVIEQSGEAVEIVEPPENFRVTEW